MARPRSPKEWSEMSDEDFKRLEEDWSKDDDNRELVSEGEVLFQQIEKERKKRKGEFRKEDGSVEESSCSAHPQRSNRDYFKGVEKKANRAIRKAKVGTTIDRSRKIAAARASSRRFIMEHRKLTEKVIAGSQTGFQMSTVVGDIPVSCFEIRDEYLCEWKTHAGTEGHGTLAWWIETDFFDKVRMTCRFPSDESPRAEGSCSAQVGD